MIVFMEENVYFFGSSLYSENSALVMAAIL